VTLHTYLSPEWQEAAAPIRAKFLASDSSMPAIRVNVTVTHVPFGDSDLHLHGVDGVPNIFEPGHIDDAAVEITLDWAMARIAVLDPTTRMLRLGLDSGEIIASGDTDALSTHWKAHIGNQAYLTLMADIRAITK